LLCSVTGSSCFSVSLFSLGFTIASVLAWLVVAEVTSASAGLLSEELLLARTNAIGHYD